MKLKQRQPISWARPPLNTRCLYCARVFDGAAVVPSKEHLIGKNFVPLGAFSQGQSFNFIFLACTDCNGQKSRLEGHVSAITQHWSREVTSNPTYAQRSSEKSQREYHPWTKRPVGDSSHEVTHQFAIGSVGVSLGLVGPPQLDRKMANELALRHIQGFFALVTNTNHSSNELTLLAPSRFGVWGEYPVSDWGNPELRALHERTRSWRTHFRCITAGLFFKCVMRQDPAAPGTWYWLLEWNQSFRIVGAITPAGQRPDFLTNVPTPNSVRTPQPDGSIWRWRHEVPLKPDADDFFDDLDVSSAASDGLDTATPSSSVLI